MFEVSNQETKCERWTMLFKTFVCNMHWALCLQGCNQRKFKHKLRIPVNMSCHRWKTWNPGGHRAPLNCTQQTHTNTRCKRWFQKTICSSLLGEMIQFDWYFSDRLKPPTRTCLLPFHLSFQERLNQLGQQLETLKLQTVEKLVWELGNEARISGE